jgi:hypothetical protein
MRFVWVGGWRVMMELVMRVLRWLLVAMLVAGIGLVCAQPFEMMRESRLRAAAATWPNVRGRVLDTTIVPRIGRHTYYGVTVTYDYLVGGQHFIRDSIWLTGTSIFISPQAARRFIDAYPVGGHVTIYYDPADPGDATLIPAGNGMEGWGYLQDGLTLIVLAWLLWSLPRLDWSRLRRAVNSGKSRPGNS